MNELYIPAPTRNAARLTVHTLRARIIAMSTSGSATCSSLTTHATSSTAAPTKRPRVRGSPHPHDEPSLMPTSRHTSQPDSSTAPPQLIFPGDLIGDSGT